MVERDAAHALDHDAVREARASTRGGAWLAPEPIKSAAEAIVRWGLAELSGLLDKGGMRCPFGIASNRWSHLGLPGTAPAKEAARKRPQPRPGAHRYV